MTALVLPRVAAFIGLVLSLYALYVEYKVAHVEEDEEFSALCDIEAIGASCSAVFQLPQGHIMSYIGLIPKGSVLDLPNAALGAVYYLYQLVFSRLLPFPITLLGALAAFSSSVFLAYHLTIIKELCILCWSTHVINTFLLYDTAVHLPKRLDSGSFKKTKTA